MTPSDTPQKASDEQIALLRRYARDYATSLFEEDAITAVLDELQRLREEAEWRALASAPRDGSRILLLIEHRNARYAKDPIAEGWIGECEGNWIDFNGGGWTWGGLYGDILGWKPLPDGPAGVEAAG